MTSIGLRLTVLLVVLNTCVCLANDQSQKPPLEIGKDYVLVLSSGAVSPARTSDDIILTPQPLDMRILEINSHWIKVQHLTHENGKLVPSGNEPFWLNLDYVVALRSLTDG